jgi:hypothetical protein
MGVGDDSAGTGHDDEGNQTGREGAAFGAWQAGECAGGGMKFLLRAWQLDMVNVAQTHTPSPSIPPREGGREGVNQAINHPN